MFPVDVIVQSDTVESLKAKICCIKNMPVEKQVLYFKQQVLENDKTLSHYKMELNPTKALVLLRTINSFMVTIFIKFRPLTVELLLNSSVNDLCNILIYKYGIKLKRKIVFDSAVVQKKRLLLDLKVRDKTILSVINHTNATEFIQQVGNECSEYKRR